MQVVKARPNWILWLAVPAILAGTAPTSTVSADSSIVLASTTSVKDSGLLAHVLPQFTAETGISARVVALGTGQALDSARRGDADLVLVHDPEAERKFMEEGHGVKRQQIAWNDFVVVGPAADPAHVKGGHDAAAAFKAIAAAGAYFVSRGDRSGTNAAERRLWKAAGVSPGEGQDMWFLDIGGSMREALNTAAAVNAYTLSDRGTWLSFASKASLTIEIEGDPRLINRYDVIQLNPEKHPDANLADAERLATWLTSREGQEAIGSDEVSGQQLFHPSAVSPK